MEIDRNVVPRSGRSPAKTCAARSATLEDDWRDGLPQSMHRAPIPEDEPIPGEEPEPEDDPVPHPDPVVREPGEAPPPMTLLPKPFSERKGLLQ